MEQTWLFVLVMLYRGTRTMCHFGLGNYLNSTNKMVKNVQMEKTVFSTSHTHQEYGYFILQNYHKFDD